MKTPPVRVIAASFVLLLFITASLRAADATYDNVIVNDNLTVTGTGYFPANTAFGTWSEGGGSPAGLTLNYTDGTTTVINFIGSGTSSMWQWSQFTGSGSPLLSMQLDQNNKLILYTSGTGGAAGITLNPAGMSTFAGSLTINGTNSVLPNQALVSGSSILTEGLGDGRYLSLSATSSFVSSSNFVVGTATSGGVMGPTYALFGGTATGANSFVLGTGTAAGTNAVTIGNSSYSTQDGVALGFSSHAGALNSIAIGNTSTSSADSLAVGVSATASGSYSVAIGYQATSSKFTSIAIGRNATASGTYSLAVGEGAIASGLDSNAIGFGSADTSDDSFAGGYGADAVAYGSTALGYSSTASGTSSFASGVFSVGGGYASAALGYYSTANGFTTTASGPWSTASGNYSTSAGPCTNATGYAQFVVGQWNITQGSASSWVATDNLFIVGNGLGSGTTSNAFVVNKNGDTTVSGGLVVSGTSGTLNTVVNGGFAVTGTSVGVVVGSGTVTTVVSTGSNNLSLVPQQGDVPMGIFVNGVQPPH